MLFQAIEWVIDQCLIPSQNYFISFFTKIMAIAIHSQVPQVRNSKALHRLKIYLHFYLRLVKF